MGAYRGNTDKVMADAAKITKLWSKDGVPIRRLMSKYHCNYLIIIKAIRSKLSRQQFEEIRKKHLSKGNRAHHFKKGHKTWNKGLHYNPGGRSIETRFKPGQIRGAAARKYKPVGMVTVRYDKPPKRLRSRKRKDGMPPWRGKPRRYIKIKDTGAPQYCWIPYARYLYEQKYGPLPTGWFVVHIDGDQMNDTIEDLTAVDRPGHLALQMKRDPGHLIRMRLAAGRAARQRHETNRQIKRLCGPQQNIFDCVNCGAGYRKRKTPEKCVKCGGGSFVEIRRRQAG